MTTAPPELLRARTLLIDRLGLAPNAVGIVGDPDHIGGYHCGSDRVRRVDGVIRDYSVIESARDRTGLSLYASALDIGRFNAGGADLIDFNHWLIEQCSRGTTDTLDIREVIYTPDGRTVRRWDRLGRRTTGDDSHLFHTHVSEFRDARGRRMVALISRWLDHIGLGDDMEQTEDLLDYPGKKVRHTLADTQRLRDSLMSTPESDPYSPPPGSHLAQLYALAARPAAELTDAQMETIAARVAALLGPQLAQAAAAAAEATVERATIVVPDQD